MLLQPVRVLDGPTSQLVSLQDEHCRSVSTTPYSFAGHTETLVPPRPRCRCCCGRCRWWTGRRRSSRRCRASLAGECPRRRARPQGTRRRTSPPRPRCRRCCSRCTCWAHRRRSSRRCKMSTAGQCPRRRTRSQGTQRRASPPRPNVGATAVVHMLDEQTSRLASLQDKHCGSVSATPYSVAAHADTHFPATSEMLVLLQSVRVLGGTRRSSCRCKMSTAGQCPRRRTRSQGTQRRLSPPRPRCRCCCSRCRCWDGQTSQLASLPDEHCRSVSTTPYSVAGHAKTHSVAATSELWVQLRSVRVLGGQTSQLAPLQE